MINDLKDKKLWQYTGWILILILIFTMPIFLKNDGLWIYYGDSYEQFYQFILGGWQRVRELQFNEWEWSLGLGGNWFAYSDTYLFSPFFWVFMLFPKEWIDNVFILTNILKFLCIFVFSYLWMKKMNRTSISCFLGGAMITFSGWIFFYNHYHPFIDAFVFFPLILYFSEVYLQTNKVVGLVISTFLLTICSYYFMYMFVPCMCLATLFRYLVLHQEKIEFKDLFKKATQYFLWMMLGILIGAFVLVPSILCLFGNPRLDEETVSLFQMIGRRDIFKFITSVFIPVFSRIDPDYFISNTFHNYLGWGNGCSLFTFIITPILLPLLYKVKNKFEVKAVIIGYGVLILFTIFPIFWVLFQQTVDTRWFFMYVFLNAYAITLINEDLLKNNINKKCVSYSAVLTGVIIVALFLISCIFNLNNTSKLEQLLIVIAVQGIAMMVYFLSYKLNWKKVVLVGVSIEILISGFVHIYYNEPRDANLFIDELKTNEMINQLQDKDDQFYRVIYDDDFYTTPNEPFSKNYPGVAFYSSVYNFNSENYLSEIKSNWSMPMSQGKYKTWIFLGVKYYYTYYWRGKYPYGYEFFDEMNGFTVLKNKYYLGHVFKNNKEINEEFFLTLPRLTRDRLFLEYTVSKDSQNKEYQFVDEVTLLETFNAEECMVHQFDYEIMNKNIYIESTFDANYIVNLKSDGEIKLSYEFNQIGYVDFHLGFRFPIDEIEIINTGNNIGEVKLYIEDFDVNRMDTWYQSRKEDVIENITVKDDEIEINFNSSETELITTNFPYDDGWKLYINEKEQEIINVNLGFIGFNSIPGENKVRLVYEAPGARVGRYISLASIVIFVFSLYRRKRNLCYNKLRGDNNDRV